MNLGIYAVTMNESHMKELVYNHASPPPLIKKSSRLVQMGFPTTITSECICSWYTLFNKSRRADKVWVCVSAVRCNSLSTPNGLVHSF